MTVWLRRQEAIHRFGTYLQWAVPGYIADADSEAADDEEETEEMDSTPAPGDEPDDSDDEAELEDGPTTSIPAYRVAKKPPFPNLTAATISADFAAPTSSLISTAFSNLTPSFHVSKPSPILLFLFTNASHFRSPKFLK